MTENLHDEIDPAEVRAYRDRLVLCAHTTTDRGLARVLTRRLATVDGLIGEIDPARRPPRRRTMGLRALRPRFGGVDG